MPTESGSPPGRRASRGTDAMVRPYPLSEWACLGILYDQPAHGFAVAARLAPAGDVGRVWSTSRPLTYRSLDQLAGRGWVRSIAEEPGTAGGPRTILAASRSGRAQLRRWIATPVVHLRDIRSELLLKIVLADLGRLDIGDMLDAQRRLIATVAASLGAQRRVHRGQTSDVVTLWRSESAKAALRFIDQTIAERC